MKTQRYFTGGIMNLRKPRLIAAAFAIVLMTAIILAGVYSTVEDKAEAVSRSANDFPVLLVHGLGEGPGEHAFGNMKKFLELLYFNVEVMDFNAYNGTDLGKNPASATILPGQAAALGMKIKEMKAQYGVSEIHIIAHSYGGLVTQAYLLNLGEHADAEGGIFEDDINKLLYIQVPFYGTNYNETKLRTLAAKTNYGAFWKTDTAMDVLKVGSIYLSHMHYMLTMENAYEKYGIDYLHISSDTDEVVEPIYGNLNTFSMGNSNRFFLMKNFNHSSSSEEGTNTIANVDRFLSKDFLSLASALSNGTSWEEFVTVPTYNKSLVINHYTANNNLKDTDIKLKDPSGKELNGKFYYDWSLETWELDSAGTYTAFFRNGSAPGGSQTSKVNVEIGKVYLNTYFPSKKSIQMNGSTVKGSHSGSMDFGEVYGYMGGGGGPDGAIFYAAEFKYPLGQTKGAIATALLPGLQTGNFYIEFGVKDLPVARSKDRMFIPLATITDQSTLGKPDDPRWNGGRISIQTFGEVGDFRYGMVNVHWGSDYDGNGYIRYADHHEFTEWRVQTGLNWSQPRHVRFEFRRTEGINVNAKMIIDGKVIAMREAGFRCAKPMLVLSNFWFAEGYLDTQNPDGATLTDLAVGNLK
jgi:pimeloyl-ACP methyl ester carboxylesterase